jgi:hypothetical protein
MRADSGRDPRFPIKIAPMNDGYNDQDGRKEGEITGLTG